MRYHLTYSNTFCCYAWLCRLGIHCALVEVDKFLRSCRMSDAEHEYCLMKDSSALLGSNVHEEFEIWTGVTSNGKTK